MLDNEKNISMNRNHAPKNISSLLNLNFELKKPLMKSVKKGSIRKGNTTK